MHRLPLADELPYRFHPPRPNPLLVRLTRPWRARMLRNEHRITEIDIAGQDYIAPLLAAGDGIMLTPNHPGRADGLILLDLADRLGHTCCTMAAYQIFEGDAGLRHWLFPRMGIFPIDREGSDLSAFKAAVDVVARAECPLVVFPEGEVYHLVDRLTPIREGAAAIAVAASKKLSEAGKRTWVVPIALKYRFPDGYDPVPTFRRLLESLEQRITWRIRHERGIVDRIYDIAGALLALKEIEHLGGADSGPLPGRIIRLGTVLLERIEVRRLGKSGSGPIPVRVKDVRRACLEALARPDLSAEDHEAIRRDLDDVFLALQCYSYPGDYVIADPTYDRTAETLMKLDEDLLGSQPATPLGPRRAVLRVGEPIPVHERVAALGKRGATPSITTELESRIQALLDTIGPGRSLPGMAAGIAPSPPSGGEEPASPIPQAPSFGR